MIARNEPRMPARSGPRQHRFSSCQSSNHKNLFRLGAPFARGFTLVELLTTIAIVAILAALILSGVSSVQRAGKNAKSISNLRQLHLVAQAFSEDNEGRLPPVAGFYPALYGGNIYHKGVMDGYGAEKVKVDPAAPKLIFGYGININLVPINTAVPVRDQTTEDWGGYGNPRFYKRSCYTWLDIEQPSKTVLYCVTPQRDQNMVWNYAGTYTMSLLTPGLLSADRHKKGQVQAVMADGHVTMLELAELLQTSPPSPYWALKK